MKTSNDSLRRTLALLAVTTGALSARPCSAQTASAASPAAATVKSQDGNAKAAAPGNPPGSKPTASGRGIEDIVGPLQRDPGCLGVETAGTTSGKRVVFAWFKNKKAAMTWYYSIPHQVMMSMMKTPRSGREPLVGVKDETTPIMIIASFTPAKNPQPGVGLPVAQIAIELYAPLPGGFALNGGFAPNSVKVEGLSRSEAPETSKKQP